MSVQAIREGLVRWLSGARSRHSVAAACVALLAGLAFAAAPALAAPPYQLSNRFETATGSAADQLSSPYDVAVNDESGDVYVADTKNNRVEEFSPGGTFIAAWGWGVADGAAQYEICASTCQKGTSGGEPGEFKEPRGIAVANSGPNKGDVYVGDTKNNRVQVFESAGTYLTQFNGSGEAPEALKEPWGIDVDASGNVYVADWKNQRIDCFEYTAGSYKYVSGFANATYLSNPTGVAVDSAGNIYVVNHEEHTAPENTVVELSQSGAYEGYLSGVLEESATGISYDSQTNDLYVSVNSVTVGPARGSVREYDASTGDLVEVIGGDELPEVIRSVAVNSANEKLYVVEPSPANVALFATEPGASPPLANVQTPNVHATVATLAGTVNPRDLEATYQFEYGTTTSYGSVSPVTAAKLGAGGEPVAVSARIVGLSPETTYHYRLVATNANGTSRTADQSFTTTAVPVAGAYAPIAGSPFGSKGPGGGQFEGPTGIAVDASTGRAYVVDETNNRVEVLGPKGEFLEAWGWGVADGKPEYEICTSACKSGLRGEGDGDGQFYQPTGVAVDDTAGRVYVADSANRRVEVFSLAGAYITQFNGSADGHPFTTNPTGIAVYESGGLSTDVVYVKDGSDEVDKFVYNAGSYEYAYELPVADTVGVQGVAVEDSGPDAGYVYVSTYEEGVREFGPDGTYLGSFLAPGANYLRQIAIDPQTGNVYVGEEGKLSPAPNAISEYSPTGHLVQRIATAESTAGIAVSSASQSDGWVYATENEADRVSIYEPVLIPGAETGAVSAVSSEGATLAGSVEPLNIEEAHWYFQYGPTTAYGATSPAPPGVGVAEQEEDWPVSAVLSGLEPNLTYHYRLVVTNANGVAYGADETFTTLAVAPAVAGLDATFEGPREAVLNAVINPENSPTSYRFEYGTSEAALGAITPVVQAGAGYGELHLGESLSGLSPSTTYYFRVVASNPQGVVTGPVRAFTTEAAPAPEATAGAAANVSQSTATLTGTVDPRGLQTSYEFQLGVDTSYGTDLFGEAGSGEAPQEVTQEVGNLAPGVTYHYRLCAINANGVSCGPDQTFTTPGYSSPLVQPITPALLPAAVAIKAPTEASSKPGSKKKSGKPKKPKKPKKKKKKKKGKKKPGKSKGKPKGSHITQKENP